jgi:hypothetical protein
MEKKIKKHAGLIIIGLYVFLQALSLPHVGMTWDEPSSFFFGRATLKFYLTGDRGYLTESEWKNPERFKDDPFQYIYGEDVYPPFPFVVGSTLSFIFAEQLGLLSVESAHHLGLVLLGALGVLGMYGIGKIFKWPEVLAAGIALLYATYPTIVGQMRNDAKDVPLMSMIVVFVFMALQWLKTQRPLFAVGTGISLGLAIGSKPTAAIMVPIFGIWFLFSFFFFPSFRKGIQLSTFIPGGIFIGMLSVCIFFLSWPWLWDDPAGKLTRVWEFFRVVGRGMPTLYLGTVYTAGGNLPWHYPLGILSFQTPESVLVMGILSIIGITGISILKKNPWPFLFVFWILIGMGRFFVPGVLIYAKVRHFIDVMPAFFVIIGLALHEIMTSFPRRREFLGSLDKHLAKIPAGAYPQLRYAAGMILLSAMLLHQFWIIATHFPYEPSYFNTLVGGTKTVAEKRLFDIEYWASTIKDGMQYIDRVSTLEQPARVYACTMAHLALFYETPKVTVTSSAVGATHTLVPNSASWFGAVAAFMRDHHELVYTVKRAGGDLLWVYKHKSFSGWHCGNETDMVYER